MISFTSKTSCKSFMIRWDHKTIHNNSHLVDGDIRVASNKDLEDLRKFFIRKGFREER